MNEAENKRKNRPHEFRRWWWRWRWRKRRSIRSIAFSNRSIYQITVTAAAITTTTHSNDQRYFETLYQSEMKWNEIKTILSMTLTKIFWVYITGGREKAKQRRRLGGERVRAGERWEAFNGRRIVFVKISHPNQDYLLSLLFLSFSSTFNSLRNNTLLVRWFQALLHIFV